MEQAPSHRARAGDNFCMRNGGHTVSEYTASVNNPEASTIDVTL